MRLAVVWVLFVTVAHAQAALQPFLIEIDRALQRGDRAAVAASIRYPVIVSIGGIRVPFQDAETLLDRYEEIFTPELRDLIARGSEVVTETREGFTFGNNALAIARVGSELKISAIVVPPADPALGASSLSPTDRAASPREPRRIGLRAGPRPTRFAGSLPAGAADSYIVFVPKGQLLDVRLERVRTEAVVQVADAATGAPLNPRTAQGALVVSGRAPASADYRIAVQRTECRRVRAALHAGRQHTLAGPLLVELQRGRRICLRRGRN